MKKNSSILFFSIVLAFPLLAFGFLNWYTRHQGHLPKYSAIDRSIETIQLTDQDNKSFNFKNWDHKIVVANFFFTHCPTICPKMTANMSKVQKAYKEVPGVYFSSFSIDPERDSAAQMKRFAIQRGLDNSNWKLLTGSKKEIYLLARNGFKIVATDGDGGPTDFIHSEKLVLVDKGKRIRGYYDGTSDKEINQLILDIKKLRNEN